MLIDHGISMYVCLPREGNSKIILLANTLILATEVALAMTRPLWKCMRIIARNPLYLRHGTAERALYPMIREHPLLTLRPARH